MAQRDHSRTLRRRNERARELGYRSYADQRRARRTGEGLRAGDKPGKRQIVEAGDKRIIRSTGGRQGFRTIAANVSRLDPEHEVEVRVTVQSRSGPRVVTLNVEASEFLMGEVGDDAADALAEEYGGTWRRATVLSVEVIYSR